MLEHPTSHASMRCLDHPNVGSLWLRCHEPKASSVSCVLPTSPWDTMSRISRHWAGHEMI